MSRNEIARRLLLSLGAWALWAAPPFAESAVAEEVAIDGSDLSGQISPEVAIFPSGDAVVVWSDFRAPEGLNIRARRFDSAGQAIGASFQVNTVIEETQTYPAVATADGGGFVVVWESLTGTVDAGIKARRYDAMAQPIGAEYAVQEATSLQERRPAISRAPDGSFMVLWTVQEDSLRARRLDAAGVPLGAELVLDADNRNFRGVALSFNDNGDFLAGWRRLFAEPGARLFDSNGAPLGPELQSPSGTAGFSISTSTYNDGQFLLTETTGETTRGQFYDPDGEPVGTEFEIASGQNALFGTAVAAAPAGEFQVVWSASDGQGGGVFTRRLTSTGAAAGASQQVNITTIGDQQQPGVGVDGTGGIVVVWQGSPASMLGVTARFDIEELGPDIFADGFESGDASSWSEVFP
ncbi:MAG: hypothetical protein AAGM22_26895 [Acidobacteriota bacterium]